MLHVFYGSLLPTLFHDEPKFLYLNLIYTTLVNSGKTKFRFSIADIRLWYN